MRSAEYNRSSQDIGNVIALDHVNIAMPDPSLAMMFYVSGLGLTRDPYLNVGHENMWINIGRQQIHLPTRSVSQRITGRINVIIGELSLLPSRLRSIRDALKGTQFDWVERGDSVEVTGPWGNVFRCLAPSERFGEMRIGIPCVEFVIPAGNASGIAWFYRDVFGAPSVVESHGGLFRAVITVGCGQTLWFTESEEAIPQYDGHHIAINVADFSSPHQALNSHNLVTEETNEHQYRFQDIVDLSSGKVLFQLEHEVRSLYHPMYGRNLVNRDPTVSSMGYYRGSEMLDIG